MNQILDTIDIGIIDHKKKPNIFGVKFDSQPAAMRHLLVAKKIIERQGHKIKPIGLDIGSKYGYLRKILSNFGIETKRLDVVDRNDNEGLIIGNGKSLPFKNNSLDFVVVSHVLAHVDNLTPFMLEINRTLKIGGDLIILQNNRYGWWKYWGYYIRGNDRAFHYRTFSSWDIRELLRKNNMELKEMKSPYYFYLHSKFSNFCFKFDRKFSHLIPNWLATQWLIVAVKSAKISYSNTPIKIPLYTRILIEPIAFCHALIMKKFELILRVFSK